MAQYLGSSLTPGNLVVETLYTCPTARAANVPTILVSHTGDSSGTQTYDIDLYTAAGAYKSTIVNAATVALGVNDDKVPGIVTMAAGETIRVRNTTASNSTKSGMASLPETPNALLMNSAGTTLIASTPTMGIFRSTDEGVSWTRVYNGASVALAHVYIVATTTFFIYLSATSALKSTDDGLTWTAQVTVLAPVAANVFGVIGNIIRNGTTYVGANTTTQLVSTTDGITWANFGVTITSGTLSSYCWTGTNYVVACGAAAGIYYSTNGAAWTAVSCGGTSVNKIVSDGAGKLYTAATAGAYYYSSDHGATVTSAVTTASNMNPFYSGSLFQLSPTQYADPAAPLVIRTLVSGFAGNDRVTQVGPSRAYYLTAQLIKTFSTDISLRKYGVSFTLSRQEVAQ